MPGSAVGTWDVSGNKTDPKLRRVVGALHSKGGRETVGNKPDA